MKVYALNYDLNKISTAISELLKLKMIMTMTEGIEIYSTEGIFYIDNNNTYKLLYNDKSITKVHHYYEEINLAIDKSVITKEITYQLPPKHLANPIKTFIFKKTLQSKIKFVIIGSNVNNNNTNHNTSINTPFTKQNFNTDLQIIVNDFYIDIQDNVDIQDDIDLNNIFIKEDICEFLSMLNKY